MEKSTPRGAQFSPVTGEKILSACADGMARIYETEAVFTGNAQPIKQVKIGKKDQKPWRNVAIWHPKNENLLFARWVPNSGETNKLYAFSISAKDRKLFRAQKMGSSDENSGADQPQAVTKYLQEAVLSIGGNDMPSGKYLFHPQIEILVGFKGWSLYLWKWIAKMYCVFQL